MNSSFRQKFTVYGQKTSVGEKIRRIEGIVDSSLSKDGRIDWFFRMVIQMKNTYKLERYTHKLRVTVRELSDLSHLFRG